MNFESFIQSVESSRGAKHIWTQLQTQTFIPLKLEPLIISITSDLAPTLVDSINIIKVKIQ